MDIRFINVSYLEEVCGGDKEIIAEMVDIFRQQVSEFNKELSELFNSGDYFSLGLMAHKAKSSVAIMGMNELAGYLKELELTAKVGEKKDMYNKYISEFQVQTEAALIELEWYMKNLQ